MSNPSSTTETADSGNSVQAVAFALRILEHVAARKEALRVTDLAAHFGTTKTRIFRHLRTLVENGYIIQDRESERYRVGSRLIALGQTVSKNFDLASVTQQPMRSLRDALNHSVVLGLPTSEGVHIISVEPSTSQIEITVRPGSVLRFNRTAQGKIALAFGDPAVMERIKAANMSATTPDTITDITELKREIAQIKVQGWAGAPNQEVTGLNALAAPVLDASGILIATVAIVNLVQFLPAKAKPADISALMRCAKEASVQLGYRGDLFSGQANEASANARASTLGPT